MDDRTRQYVGVELHSLWRPDLHGQHDAGRLWLFDAVARVAGVDTCPLVGGLLEVARSAGWWWPFERAAVLRERPIRLRYDDEGQLHAKDGFAIEYPDGFGVEALDGMRMTNEP
jgi:hypothetical protein